MKILLTGNEGYIGIILGDALRSAGHQVSGLDTGFYNQGWLYSGPKTLETVIKKDIREVEQPDLAGFDVLVHMAELSNDPLGENDPELTFNVNHRGTVRLIELAKKAGIPRMIYFSSCSVYGASDEFVDETSATTPLTAYAKSKVLNENYLMEIATDNFSPMVFRNSTVYGASPRMRFDLAVNNLTGLAFTTHEIKMDSDGSPWRPFVHVRDVAKAVVTAINTSADLTHKQIINIGSNQGNYQIKTVAEIIAQVIPKCKVTFNPQGADKRNYKVKFDKLARVLPGFSCDWDVEKGVKELVQIFESVNLSHEVFTSADFTRLKTIKSLKDQGKLNNQLFWN